MAPKDSRASSEEEHLLVVRLPEKTSLPETSQNSSQEPPRVPSQAPKPQPTPVPIPTEDPNKPPAYLVLPSGSTPPFTPSPELFQTDLLKEESPEELASLVSEVPAPLPEDWEKKSQGSSPDSEGKELPLPINRVRRVEAFLKAWGEGNGDSMYEMLSLKSRENLSREAFTEMVLEDQFRFALKNPYTLKWEGENTVKVVAPQKMLVMRVLRSKVLRLVLERGAWYIAW
jgi:hypothetical protein